jgi:hypothetical protein
MPKSALKSNYRANNGNNGNATRKAKKGVRFPATMIPVTDVGETHLKTSLKKLTQKNPKTGKEEPVLKRVLVENPKTGEKKYVMMPIMVYNSKSGTYNRTSIVIDDKNRNNMAGYYEMGRRISKSINEGKMKKGYAMKLWHRVMNPELYHVLNTEEMRANTNRHIQKYDPLWYSLYKKQPANHTRQTRRNRQKEAASNNANNHL